MEGVVMFKQMLSRMGIISMPEGNRRRFFLLGALAFSELLAAFGFLRGRHTAIAQEEKGSLKGTVLNRQGKPVLAGDAGTTGQEVIGVLNGEREFVVQCDPNLGGFYSVKDLKIGVYEIFVPRGHVENVRYRPLRICDVVIRPGVSTSLYIVMNEGDALEERGEPKITTQQVVLRSVN
jgi:hypothetical protein